MTRKSVLHGLVYFIVVGGAIVGDFAATRGAQAPTPMAAGHNHGAPAGSDSARPVMLTPDQARRIGVTFTVAALGALQKEVRTVGQVTYDETRAQTVTTKIDGFVERLFVNATGQPVAYGDSLFTIYSPMLVTAEEELLLARRLQRDVATASPDVQKNATELALSARRRLIYWDIPEAEVGEIERTAEVRRTLTLRSPATGYVVEKNVVAGQKIMAGDVLYRVVDLSAVWVEGEVFEQDLATVRVGQAVEADFQALPTEHRAGRIAYVYPTVNPDTRTARVRVVLPNADHVLKPGMYATLRILGTTRTGVLTIPRDAVLSTGERNIVFVREASGHLAPHEVALGSSNDERVEILRGVSAGDTIVASATFLVDAESNLGKALGGMGNMPGMEMTAPPKPLPGKSAPAGKQRAPDAPMEDMPGMPGMDHGKSSAPLKKAGAPAGHKTP